MATRPIGGQPCSRASHRRGHGSPQHTRTLGPPCRRPRRVGIDASPSHRRSRPCRGTPHLPAGALLCAPCRGDCGHDQRPRLPRGRVCSHFADLSPGAPRRPSGHADIDGRPRAWQLPPQRSAIRFGPCGRRRVRRVGFQQADQPHPLRMWVGRSAIRPR